MKSFEGKVALVVGGGSALGRAIAVRLAGAGARTIVVDPDAAAAQATLADIRAQGGQGITIQADIADSASVAAAVHTATEAYGAIHSLHNVIGAVEDKPTHTMSDGDWDEVMRLTLKPVYLWCHNTVPVILNSGGGSVVTTASVLGLVARPGQAAYGAAMGAIVLLTKQMAVDYSALGIRVNCICPSDVETPTLVGETREGIVAKHPIKRLAQVGEVAEAAVWLASDAASFITGVSLPVDGGLTAW